jgi:dephospho-CoA kinase
MSLICLEGVDKTGKSTIASLYSDLGYTVVHMSAPDKKYNDPKYIGPTYFDEMVEMYEGFTHGDFLCDRTIYGETIWSKVYKRRPQLLEPDINFLRDMENELGVRRILLVDEDVEAHWNRCVKNKEPLTREQFDKAYALYYDMAAKYDFEVMTMPALYLELTGEEFVGANKKPLEIKPIIPLKKSSVAVSEPKIEVVRTQNFVTDNDPKERLAEANAINTILAAPILKKKGDAFERIENEIRTFLNGKLKKLMGTPSDDLTSEEIFVLKTMVQRMKDKGVSK